MASEPASGEILPKLAGKGGTALFHKVWRPETPGASAQGGAVVVIVHGLAEHCDRYANVVGPLVEADFTVVGYDHRGHGRSDGDRAFVRSYDEFLDDLDVVLDDVEQRYPEAPITLLGHSMGGNIALGYVLSAPARQERLAGLILSGPALGGPDTPTGLAAKALHALAKRAPGLRFVPLDADAISRDPTVVEDYRNDPLVFTGKMSAGLASALVQAIEALPKQARSVTLPTLIVHGTADKLCDVAKSRELEVGLVNAEVTSHYYDGLYHEVFNEPEHPEVVADVVAWLKDQQSAQ